MSNFLFIESRRLRKNSIRKSRIVAAEWVQSNINTTRAALDEAAKRGDDCELYIAAHVRESLVMPHIMTKQYREQLTVIVVGNNNCWGRGVTLSEAIRNAERPKFYIAWLCGPDTRVDPVDGSLSFPIDGLQPIKIDEKLPTNKKQ